MNNHELTTQVSQHSGISTEICMQIIKAFEKQSQDSLINRLKGKKESDAELISGIAQRTGNPVETCEKVVNALNKVMDQELTGKLNPFKKQ